MRIFIVEDDDDIREMESYALKNSGYEITEFSSGESFFEALKSLIPDLIILDIMLPNEDGMSILDKLKKNDSTKNIPVIMVTAKSSELDKVKGLDCGADDFITKPFGIMEFVSRVKAVLRRVDKGENTEKIICGNIVIDDAKRIVYSDNQPCELTYKEYELLKTLITNKDIVLSRERLMNLIWGFDYHVESRTVDMHIKTLRKKLGDSGNMIKTIRNVGYRIGE